MVALKTVDVEMSNNWTIVYHEGSDGCTEKTRVEGGWLYRSQVWDKADGTSMALAFVPDKESTKSGWTEFRHKIRSALSETYYQSPKDGGTEARLDLLAWVLKIMPSE